jgi:thiamine biosynthesis lipoprotein ApbE
MEADALATACMVMEPKAALAMVESMEGAEALLIADNGKGGYRFVSTEGFPEIMK